MRVSAIVVGTAVLLAACGGGQKAQQASAPESTGAGAGAAAAAPSASGGATHVINMVQTGPNSYRFEPDTFTIKVGDVVDFKSVSGQMHDVAFWADSIPPGAADVLNAAIPDQTAPLSTAMIPEGQDVSISFAGAPTGVYKFYCIPHIAMGMKGQLTVTQ
jgi:plastocyanin